MSGRGDALVEQDVGCLKDGVGEQTEVEFGIGDFFFATCFLVGKLALERNASVMR